MAPEPEARAGVDEDPGPDRTPATDLEPLADDPSVEPVSPLIEAEDLLPEAPPPGPAEPR